MKKLNDFIQKNLGIFVGLIFLFGLFTFITTKSIEDDEILKQVKSQTELMQLGSKDKVIKLQDEKDSLKDIIQEITNSYQYKIDSLNTVNEKTLKQVLNLEKEFKKINDNVLKLSK